MAILYRDVLRYMERIEQLEAQAELGKCRDKQRTESAETKDGDNDHTT